MASAKSICNKRSKQCQKNKKLEVFLFFCIKSFLSLVISAFNVFYRILDDTQEQTFHYKRFSLKITNTHCCMKRSKILQIHAEKK